MTTERSLVRSPRPCPAPFARGGSSRPETSLRWHRKRIAQHWTQPQRPPGRPSTHAKVVALIVETATDNPTWGYRRIAGELRPAGHKAGASTVWRILKQHNIDPSPNRVEVTWTQFLRSQAAVACDFATIDTAFLRPLLPTVRHRCDQPTGLLRRYHHQPDRRLGHPSRPQPVHSSRQPARTHQGSGT